MKSLIILCSLALVVSADNLCSRGESYWCSDIRMAKQCGAIQHCTDTVWKNTVPAKDSSDVCQFCKVIVQEVRSLLSDKKTQQEIQKYMESACAVIPDAQIATNCKDIVDNYLPEAIQLIELFADPATVCNALGICSGFKDRVSYAGDALKAEPICADCKKFVGDIRDLITDKTTEDEVKALFKSQLCSVLGLLADQCNQLVDAYTPELLKLLSQQVEPEVVCGALGVCNGNRGLLAAMRMQKSPLYAEASKMSSEVTCIACKTLLTDLQLIVRDPAIQIDLQTFLNNNLCEKLGTLKQTCLDTVKMYSKTIIELIVNEMEPNERCKAFGFCAAAAASAASVPLARVTLEKSEPIVKVTAGTKSHVSPQCVLCEFVVKEVDTLIADNATEEEIISALDKVCSIMPDTVKKECEDFVNTYGKAILELLKSELDPQQVCTTLGLCSEATVAVHPMPMLLFQGQPKAAVGAKDGETCALCETVMAYVTSMITENSTEAEIEQLLDKVCNYLPKNLQSECLALIEQYGKQIIEMIVKEATPKEICTMLGLCSSAAAPAPRQPAAMPLLGAKPCTRGPEYWCSSKEAADECKMMVYCQRTAWRQK